MPELRALFDAIGADDVSTYVQSGNVVFKSSVGRGKLVVEIEERIRRDLGLDVTVLLRTRAQLAKVASGNPFARAKGDPGTFHVTFLAEKPQRVRVQELEPVRSKRDELRVIGQEVYLYCPHGYGRSKFSNAFLEKRLGVAATTRNWKTVTALAELVTAASGGSR